MRETSDIASGVSPFLGWEAATTMHDIATLLTSRFGLTDLVIQNLQVPVNDVFRVSSAQGEFALKLYNVKSRNRQNVMWEMELLQHLERHVVPSIAPISGANGFLEYLFHNGEKRVAALYPWATGSKPAPSRQTYLQLGEAAAKIHTASDSFTSSYPREAYDLEMLIDIQLARLRSALESVGQWQRMSQMAHRLRTMLEAYALDYGVCHMDLTLDNVHIHEGKISVFDFDSAALGFRANEAHGVCKFSRKYFQYWLEGYRAVRSFPVTEERAVYIFAIVGDIRGVSWKMGLAESSRGNPLMQAHQLPAIVDGWLQWEQDFLA